MIVIHMWTKTTCFVFQETDSAGVSHLVYTTMLCYFNRQLQGNVILTDLLVTEAHLLTFCSVMLQLGPWRGIFVVNSPFVAQAHFMTPLCKTMPLERYNYSLSDGRRGTMHHRERKALLVTGFTLVSGDFSYCASRNFLNMYWGGLWHHHNWKKKVLGMCSLSQDRALSEVFSNLWWT